MPSTALGVHRAIEGNRPYHSLSSKNLNLKSRRYKSENGWLAGAELIGNKKIAASRKCDQAGFVSCALVASGEFGATPCGCFGKTSMGWGGQAFAGLFAYRYRFRVLLFRFK